MYSSVGRIPWRACLGEGATRQPLQQPAASAPPAEERAAEAEAEEVLAAAEAEAAATRAGTAPAVVSVSAVSTDLIVGLSATGSRRQKARSALEAWPQAIAQSQSALPSFSICW